MKRLSYLGLVAVVVSIILSYYYGRLYLNESGWSLAEMLAGTAARPYVYRLLIPMLIRLVVGLGATPAQALGAVLWLALFGYVLAVRYLAAVVYGPADLLALLSVIAMTPLMFVANHIYDFGILFLFTLGLGLLAAGKTNKFMWLFPLICLAKETALLLVVLFAIENGSRGRLAILAVLYGAIRLWLGWWFADNPGANFEIHLAEWLAVIRTAPLVMLLVYCSGALVVGLGLYHWEARPVFLRRAGAVLVPVLALLHVVGGMPLELRVFYEVYPVLFLLAAPLDLTQKTMI